MTRHTEDLATEQLLSSQTELYLSTEEHREGPTAGGTNPGSVHQLHPHPAPKPRRDSVLATSLSLRREDVFCYILTGKAKLMQVCV